MENKVNEFMKWPENKLQYDKNYLRAFGKICGNCKGAGHLPNMMTNMTCRVCKGIGYVEKDKSENKK